jgi:hypothetical protein
MRAAYIAALIVLFAAVVTMEQTMPRHHAAHPSGRLLLAQSITNQQSGAAAPPATVTPRPKDKDNNAKHKADGTAQPPDSTTPGTTPWIGAPPQFQRTWPPTALPQSDENDDLLLMMAPHKPPKLHRA